MLYHWKQPRMWGIGLTCGKKTDGTFNTRTVVFLPGVHEMDDQDWADLKNDANYKTIEERIEGGILQVEIEKVKEGKKPIKRTDSGLPQTLENFDPKDAIELVSGVVEDDQLKTWNRSEKRPAVKTAIKKQLEAIAFATQPKEKKE